MSDTMLKIRWREGRRPVSVNNTFLLDLRAPSMPCRLVQVTLEETAPEAKHPLNSAWFDLLTTSQTFTGKDFTGVSHDHLMGSKSKIFFTALPSLLWITLHVTRFSLTVLLPKAELNGGLGGGYIPRVELMQRSVCARKFQLERPPEVEFAISQLWGSSQPRRRLGKPREDGRSRSDSVPLSHS